MTGDANWHAFGCPPLQLVAAHFIGRIGTLLGESKVNIATFQVDQPISPELLKKIAALEGVVQAKLLSF